MTPNAARGFALTLAGVHYDKSLLEHGAALLTGWGVAPFLLSDGVINRLPYETSFSLTLLSPPAVTRSLVR